jgi:hypothetical protein
MGKIGASDEELERFLRAAGFIPAGWTAGMNPAARL